MIYPSGLCFPNSPYIWEILALFCPLPTSSMSLLTSQRRILQTTEEVVLVDEQSCFLPSFYPPFVLLLPYGQVPPNASILANWIPKSITPAIKQDQTSNLPPNPRYLPCCRFFRRVVGLCLPMTSSSESFSTSSFPTSLRVRVSLKASGRPEYPCTRSLVMPSTKLVSCASWRRMRQPSVTDLLSLRCGGLPKRPMNERNQHSFSISCQVKPGDRAYNQAHYEALGEVKYFSIIFVLVTQGYCRLSLMRCTIYLRQREGWRERRWFWETKRDLGPLSLYHLGFRRRRDCRWLHNSCKVIGSWQIFYSRC